jgi:glyoxylase-like metal-dependent hydrolase (beta-lactamase superfamily II)
MSAVATSVKTFGNIEVSLIHAGYIHWGPKEFPGDWRTPDLPLDAQGRAIMGVNTMVVRTAHALIVVDPVSINDTDSTAPWSEMIAGPPLSESFDELGIDPADVTHVVITHGHPDHYLGVLLEPRAEGKLRFRNAEHYYPKADWDQFVANPPDLPEGHSHRTAPKLMLPVERAGKVVLVEGDIELVDGVDLVHTPGETAGHQLVRIDTSEGLVIHVGDLFHLPVELANVTWTALQREYPGLVESRLRVLNEAATDDATVVLTHGRFPPWGTVRELAQDSYRWQYA